MKKTKSLAHIFLAILFFCSTFFFTGCEVDPATVGTYHLTKMTYTEDNKTVTVNLNILINAISGYSMKLILNEDNTALLEEKNEGVEVVTRGSWSERENGDVELLFNDVLTIATHTDTTLTITDATSVMVFQKFFLNF